MNKIIGIDLGTTNSLVAYHENSKTTVLADKSGNKMIPSVISILDNETILVGQRAKDLQRSNYQNTIYSAKRYIGQHISDFENEKLPAFIKADEDGNLKIEINNELKDISEISASILKEIAKRAEDYFKMPIQRCVITVPAYFNDNQRKATAKAGQLAGLSVEKIINEPTAAALAYGLDKKIDQTIAVYDLGGGTFDISILKLKEGIFDVLSTNGDTRLGGDDIDQAIISFIAEKIEISLDKISNESLEYLRYIAENVKIELSQHDSIELTLNAEEFTNKVLKLTESDLTEIMKPILKRTKKSVKAALKDAELDFEDIDNIVMVGGSTKSPIVQRTVENWFGKKAYNDINPDEVVAVGAAIQASILEGAITDTVLLDITPLSLGMETIGGVTEKFIMRNSKIPCSVTQTFTTSKDNQSVVKINIVQGERELIEDNIQLGEFSLKNISPKAAGIPRIDVNFKLDSNGILTVSAIDSSSGSKEEITVETMKNLNDEKVEDMLFSTLKYAKEDVSKRLMIDATNEAKAIILATENAIKRNRKLINDSELDQIKSYIDALISIYKNASNHNEIMNEIEKFDKNTEFFAERIMNTTIKHIVENKTLDQLDKK